MNEVDAVPSTSAAEDPSRPRLRGWVVIGAFGAVPFEAALVQEASRAPDRWGALYAVSLVMLLATSGVYHTITWAPAPSASCGCSTIR